MQICLPQIAIRNSLSWQGGPKSCCCPSQVTRMPLPPPTICCTPARLPVQVQFAFLAGLALVLLLIPVNRVLANRIQAASVQMMGAKDRRGS